MHLLPQEDRGLLLFSWSPGRRENGYGPNRNVVEGLGGPVVARHFKQGMEVEMVGNLAHSTPASKGQGLDHDKALVRLR